MSESAVMEQEQAAPAVKQPMPAEQKQAATMRRDATLLRKYGDEKKAAELEAQADKLFPVEKKSGRVDPLSVLDKTQQTALKDYFRTTQGFARLCQVVSAKKLQEIAEELSA